MEFPLKCTLGQTCFIQNYVDRDPSSLHRDFGCGALSYNAHRGTDFALVDWVAMTAGVDVHPASAGTVTATRDGMPDILFTDANAPDIVNKECGNAVILRHEEGWETRYCHLRQGSISVRTGEQVTPDTVIGQVGLSGKTEFPHLHISVLKDGTIVDPFQPNGSTVCGETQNSLWVEDIEYIAGGLISAGFSDEIPEFAVIKAGGAHKESLSTMAPALVVWAQIFGGRKGDAIVLEIRSSQATFLSKTVLLDRTQARLFRAVGRKRRAETWPKGKYTGLITLIRNGIKIDSVATAVEIAD